MQGDGICEMVKAKNLFAHGSPTTSRLPPNLDPLTSGSEPYQGPQDKTETQLLAHSDGQFKFLSGTGFSVPPLDSGPGPSSWEHERNLTVLISGAKVLLVLIVSVLLIYATTSIPSCF
jgi:hypothetical protein